MEEVMSEYKFNLGEIVNHKTAKYSFCKPVLITARATGEDNNGGKFNLYFVSNDENRRMYFEEEIEKREVKN